MGGKGATSCPTLSLLHVAGKRWTVPILEALYAANRGMQFGAIQEEIGAITPKNLSGGLKELVEAGLVERDEILYGGITGYEASAPGSEYRITKMGQEFQKLIVQSKELGICWYGLDKGCIGSRCSRCALF